MWFAPYESGITLAFMFFFFFSEGGAPPQKKSRSYNYLYPPEGGFKQLRLPKGVAAPKEGGNVGSALSFRDPKA
jgi:hypothetical protein